MKNHNNYHVANNTTIDTVKMTQNDPIMSQNDPIMTQNDPIKLVDLNNSKLFFCRFCNRQFSTKAHMRRHELHRCKNNNLKIKNLIEEHDKEKKKLYKQIEKLLEDNGKAINCINGINGNNNNNNNNNTTNNIHQNNNIVINNYGDEDLSHITNSVLDNLIKAPGNMINNLTKMIHFNVDKPENMNMYIPSRKQKYIKVFKQNQWMLEKKNERIPDLIDRNYNIIDSYYEDCGGSDKLTKTSNKFYKNYQKLIDDKNEKVIKQEYDACELEILNNSDKVMNLHNLNN